MPDIVRSEVAEQLIRWITEASSTCAKETCIQTRKSSCVPDAKFNRSVVDRVMDRSLNRADRAVVADLVRDATNGKTFKV